MGWKGYHTKAVFDNNKIVTDTKISKTYVKLFEKDCMLRPSCYFCQFCSTARTGDISICDFWGIDMSDKGMAFSTVTASAGTSIFFGISI